MAHYFQTAEAGQHCKVGFEYIEQADVIDLLQQAADAGLLPIVEKDVTIVTCGNDVAVIVKAESFMQAAQKARAAGVAFRN